MSRIETPFYTGNIKKRIAMLFMLFGAIITIDAVIVLIVSAQWKDSPVLDIFHYYVTGISMVILWGALSFLLTGKDRVASILKVSHCLLVLMVGIENVGIHWIMILLFNIPVYILLITSKSLTPFRLPAIILLSTSLFSFIAPLIGTALDIKLEMAGYLIYAVTIGAGALTILNFKHWMYDEERAI